MASRATRLAALVSVSTALAAAPAPGCGRHDEPPPAEVQRPTPQQITLSHEQLAIDGDELRLTPDGPDDPVAVLDALVRRRDRGTHEVPWPVEVTGDVSIAQMHDLLHAARAAEVSLVFVAGDGQRLPIAAPSTAEADAAHAGCTETFAAFGRDRSAIGRRVLHSSEGAPFDPALGVVNFIGQEDGQQCRVFSGTPRQLDPGLVARALAELPPTSPTCDWTRVAADPTLAWTELAAGLRALGSNARFVLSPDILDGLVGCGTKAMTFELRPRATSIRGPLERVAIDDALANVAEHAKACVPIGPVPADEPVFPHEVAVEIGPDGTVTRTTPVDPGDAIAACVAGAIDDLVFPEPRAPKPVTFRAYLDG